MNFILLIIFIFQIYNFYENFIVYYIILLNGLFPNLIHSPYLPIFRFHLSLLITFLISPFLIPNGAFITIYKYIFYF